MLQTLLHNLLIVAKITIPFYLLIRKFGIFKPTYIFLNKSCWYAACGCLIPASLWFAETYILNTFCLHCTLIICVMFATETDPDICIKSKIWIWFWFPKLSRSSLAPSLFLSAFQAQVWSGKSIMVVKWALSKHPSGATTPLPGSAKAWSWMWASSLIKTHHFCSMGVYTQHDNRWYLDNMILYRGTCVRYIVTFLFTPLLFSLIPICVFILRLLVCVSLECVKGHRARGRGLICRNVSTAVISSDTCRVPDVNMT